MSDYRYKKNMSKSTLKISSVWIICSDIRFMKVNETHTASKRTLLHGERFAYYTG